MIPLKGKAINWIIFAILILAFFGFLLLIQSGKKTQEPTPVKINEDATKVTKPRKQFAVDELNPEQKYTKDNDAFNQALLSGTGCENIKFDEKLKQLCFDTLTYNEAMRKVDETLCEKISDDKLKTKCYDQIFLTLGIKNFDKNLCDKIKDSDTKQNCYDQVIALSGTAVKQASDCDAVKDMALKQTCLDNYYFATSTGNLDNAGCANISGADLKDRCLQTITKTKAVAEASAKQAVRTYQTAEEQIKNCDNMSGNSATTCKDQANFMLAGEKMDISYCNKITDTKTQTNCVKTQTININSYYLRQAIRSKNSSLCNKILDTELRATCLSNTK